MEQEEPKFVTMRHPDLGLAPSDYGDSGYPQATEAAFGLLWSKKGWERVPDTEAAVAVLTGGETTDLSKLSKDELADLAAGQGVDPAGLSKPQLVEALTPTSAPVEV